MTLVVNLPTPGGDPGVWDDKLNAAIAAIVAYVNNVEVAAGAVGTADSRSFVWSSGGWVPAIPSSAPAGVRRFDFYGPNPPTGLPAYIGTDIAAGQILATYTYAATT